MRYIVEEGWRFEEWCVYDKWCCTCVGGSFGSFAQAAASCAKLNEEEIV